MKVLGRLKNYLESLPIDKVSPLIYLLAHINIKNMGEIN